MRSYIASFMISLLMVLITVYFLFAYPAYIIIGSDGEVLDKYPVMTERPTRTWEKFQADEEKGQRARERSMEIWDKNNPTFTDRLQHRKHFSWPYTALPWFFIGLLLGFRRPLEYVFMALPFVGLLSVQWLWPRELVLMALLFTVGAAVRSWFKKRKVLKEALGE